MMHKRGQPLKLNETKKVGFRPIWPARKESPVMCPAGVLIARDALVVDAGITASAATMIVRVFRMTALDYRTTPSDRKEASLPLHLGSMPARVVAARWPQRRRSPPRLASGWSPACQASRTRIALGLTSRNLAWPT